MEGLREEAVKLYRQLVTSPPLRLSPAVLSPYIILALIDPKGFILLATAPLAAFLASFGVCSRATPQRLLGVYMYTSPFAIASIAARLLGLNPLYPIVNAPLALLPMGLCGSRGLAVYLAYAALSGSLYGLRASLFSTAAALLSSTIVALGLGGRGLSYARAAILAWADDNYELLESIIEGVEEEVTWNALILKKNDGDFIGLVEPGIHYGPFRGVGSSRFPYYLLKASQWRLFPLHGCGSHERNLVSSRDAASYATRIAESATVNARRCRAIKPDRVEAGHWSGILLGCSEKPFLLATSNRGVEDVPCSAIPYKDSIVFIDMHNFETDRPKLEHLDALIEKALRAKTQCTTRPRCCWRLIHLDEKLASKLNLCSAWLLYLRYECSGEGLEMVLLPANNIEPNAAKAYASSLREVNLLTIDDHSCAAAIEEGVAPLQFDPRLVDIVNSARRECRMDECEVMLASGSARLRLWGMRTMHEIRALLKRGLRLRFIPLMVYLVALSLLLV